MTEFAVSPVEPGSNTIYGGVWSSCNHIGHYYYLGPGNTNAAYHTGDDVIAPTPGETAHKPIAAIADGKITFARRITGTTWGNVIIQEVTMPDGKLVYIRYAHVENMLVTVGDTVARGQHIADVGNSFGRFAYHLHLDISLTDRLKRYPGDWPGVDMARIKRDYVDPKAWIEEHMNTVPNPDPVLVDVIATDTLNVRAEPSKTAVKMGLIPKGMKVQVKQGVVQNGYASVTYAALATNGWALDSYLKPVPVIPTGTPVTMYVTATDGLRIRESGTVSAKQIGSLTYRTEVQVLDNYKTEEGYIKLADRDGWVSSLYLSTTQPAPVVTPTTPPVIVTPVSKTQTIGIHYMPGGNDDWIMGLLQDVKKAGKLPLFIKLVKMAGGFSNGLSVQQVKSVWADCVVMVRYYDDSWEQHVNQSLEGGWNKAELTHEGTILCRDYLARFYNVDPDYRAADYQQILCEPIVGKGTPSFWLGAMAEAEKVGARLAVLCNPMGWPPLPDESGRPDTREVYTFWNWPDTLAMVERVIAGGHCLMFDEYIYPDIGDTNAQGQQLEPLGTWDDGRTMLRHDKAIDALPERLRGVKVYLGEWGTRSGDLMDSTAMLNNWRLWAAQNRCALGAAAWSIGGGGSWGNSQLGKHFEAMREYWVK